jgi:phage-related protein
MGNKMSAFGSTILQAFLPIGEGLISIIEPIFSLIQFTTKIAISSIKFIGQQFKNIMNIVKGIFTLDMSLIGDSFMAVISAPINYLRDMFPKTMEYIGGLVTGIKDKFTKMIPKETLDKISGSFKSMKESWEKIKGTLAKSFEKIKTAFLPVKEAWTKIFGESKSTLFDTIGKVFGFVAGVVGNVIGKVFGVIASIVERVANVFGYVASVLSGDIGLGEALMGIGSEIIGLFMTVPTLLWDGFTSIFGGIGSWLKDKILSGLGSIGTYLFGDDEESSTETEIKTSSTPADQSDIMKAKSPIGETEMGTISQMAASGDIVGAAKQVAGTDMSEVVNAIKELTNVSTANKDVYIDNEKITSRITKTQEKSNINQFGLMGA